MNDLEKISSNKIAQQLASLEQAKFTGKLEIISNTDKQWKFYLVLGRIVWADGGEHPYRSWQRHLIQYCHSIKLRRNDIAEAEKFECWNYYILTVLSRRKTIPREQIIALIKNKITEVLFDIFQQETSETLQYKAKFEDIDFLLVSGLKLSLTLIDVKSILAQTEQAWLAWFQKGFERLSPNLVPSLKKPEQLQQEVSSEIYRNLAESIDGQRTLRDLAVHINSDLLKLTCSLVDYIDKGLIELIKIPDLCPFESPVISLPTIETALPQQDVRQPLVACIDDSRQICKVMEYIVTKAGYRFVAIQEPLEAVYALITSEPDLIFLDIGMPIVNGYEICSQIRRVSKLKQTPVVMLTGHDGLVDRVRAKIVGASGFVSKPIEITKIINSIKKFLAEDNDSKRNRASTLQEVQLTLEQECTSLTAGSTETAF